MIYRPSVSLTHAQPVYDEMMSKGNRSALILVFFWEKKETGDLVEMSELQAETCLRLKCVAHKNLSLSVQTPPNSSQAAPRLSVLYIPPALYRSSTTAN